MSAPGRPRAQRRQRGIAAIELAIIAGLCVLALPWMLVLCRALWQYSVLQKAVYAGARYVASVPARELATVAGFEAARGQARAMVRAAAIAGNIDAPPELGAIEVDCEPGCAGGPAQLPLTVQVRASVYVVDRLFGDTVTNLMAEPIVLNADVTLRHGN